MIAVKTAPAPFFSKDPQGEVWYIEKRENGLKVCINIRSMFSHVTQAAVEKEYIRCPSIIIKYKNIRQYEHIHLSLMGAKDEKGAYKTCWLIRNRPWVALKIKSEEGSLFASLKREVELQKFLAKGHPGFCPLYFAFSIPSRKKPGLLKVVFLAKKFDCEIGQLIFENNYLHRIFIAVSEAIKFAHDNGIVLSDIKDENILYNQLTGKAVITDLGGAFRIGSERLALRFSHLTPNMIVASCGGPLPEKSDDVFIWGLTMNELVHQHEVAQPYNAVLNALKRDNKLAQDVLINIFFNSLRRFIRYLPYNDYRQLFSAMFEFDGKKRPNIDKVLESLNRLTNP